MTRRIEALRAMAGQDVSPHERDIARAKLESMGSGADEPPRRPPAAPAPGGWWPRVSSNSSANVTSSSTWFRLDTNGGTW